MAEDRKATLTKLAITASKMLKVNLAAVKESEAIKEDKKLGITP